jgi:hypothetical protein
VLVKGLPQEVKDPPRLLACVPPSSGDVDTVKEELPEGNHGIIDLGAHANERTFIMREFHTLLAGGSPRGDDDITDESVEPLRMSLPQHMTEGIWDIILSQYARPYRVTQIMVHVGNGVTETANLGFQRQLLFRLTKRLQAAPLFGVVEDSLADLPSEVEAVALLL